MIKSIKIKYIFLLMTLLINSIYANNSKTDILDINQIVSKSKCIFKEKQCINKILKEEFKLKGIKEIIKIKGGYSGSKLYKIITKENNYILKHITNYKYSFEEEVRSAKFFDKYHHLGPKIYSINIKRNMILMEFLENDPIDLKLRRSKKLVTE